MRVTLALDYPAAIPLGHRVEATWYLRPSSGRKPPAPAKETEPFLVDLDTGTRYGAYWHFSEVSTFRRGRPGIAPLDGLQVDRVARGRVTACTIVHYPEPSQHTLLELEQG